MVGAGMEDGVDLVGLCEELLVALAGGGVAGDQAFGEEALQVGAAGGGGGLMPRGRHSRGSRAWGLVDKKSP